MWTRFHDMHSGGGCKEQGWEKIYIEAPEEEAKVIFYNRFGHNPDRVSCTCCGRDYSIEHGEDLDQITAFDRGCAYIYANADGHELPECEAFIPGKGVIEGYKGMYVERPSERQFSFNKFCTLEEYLARKDVHTIRTSEIKPKERVGEVPVQGYVYV